MLKMRVMLFAVLLLLPMTTVQGAEETKDKADDVNLVKIIDRVRRGCCWDPRCAGSNPDFCFGN
uniref:Ubs_26 putative toxin n=1 Tax=Unedogemmula bisaya TaxID=746885 RepID=A0A098LXY9_UNEBI